MDEQYRRQPRWYREPGSSSDEPIARKEFKALPVHGRAALLEALRRFQRQQERGAEVAFFCNVRGYPSLYELRVQVGTDPFRILFFQDTPVHFVLVLAVYKNQKKLPKADRDKAIKRLKRWRDNNPA